MATSTIKGGYIKRTGTKTFANVTVTDLTSIELPSGLWVVTSTVKFTAGTSGSSEGQNRLTADGTVNVVKFNADTGINSPSATVIVAGGQTVSLASFVYQGGSSNTCQYTLSAVKVG